MKITALAPDSVLPNLAIEKVKKYHKDRGDEVFDLDIFIPVSDLVYVSLVFSKSKELGQYYLQWDNALIGGTGWDVKSTLPVEIDAVKPRINYGFTSRGCNNHCSFCVVHDKEGMAHPVGDIYDLWDGKSRLVTLLDNNILQLPDHFNLIASQALKEKIRLDFNQGLDHKLLTPDICKTLKEIKTKRLHFAFDNPAYEKSVLAAISMLRMEGINNAMWYVLVGYNTSKDEDMHRVELLKAHGHDPYVMRHEKCYLDRWYSDFAAWCNQPALFKKMQFAEFVNVRHNTKKNLNEIKNNS
jgi:hypothetical protein